MNILPPVDLLGSKVRYLLSLIGTRKPRYEGPDRDPSGSVCVNVYRKLCTFVRTSLTHVCCRYLGIAGRQWPACCGQWCPAVAVTCEGAESLGRSSEWCTGLKLNPLQAG